MYDGPYFLRHLTIYHRFPSVLSPSSSEKSTGLVLMRVAAAGCSTYTRPKALRIAAQSATLELLTAVMGGFTYQRTHRRLRVPLFTASTARATVSPARRAVQISSSQRREIRTAMVDRDPAQAQYVDKSIRLDKPNKTRQWSLCLPTEWGCGSRGSSAPRDGWLQGRPLVLAVAVCEIPL